MSDAGEPAAATSGASSGLPIRPIKHSRRRSTNMLGSGERNFSSAAARSLTNSLFGKVGQAKIADGELPAHRVGRLLRVGEADLAAHLAGGSVAMIISNYVES